MKKILLMALTMTGLGIFSAAAQTTTVCSISQHKGACYNTKYAENFPVCKADGGYYICGETPTKTNSTVKNSGSMPEQYAQQAYEPNRDNDDVAEVTPKAMVAPQSQSYPAFNVTNANAYEGYYPEKHYIKVSYSGNVADENLAPYEGLPSPQYDGPQKNDERNINASNPNANLAPITGRAE